VMRWANAPLIILCTNSIVRLILNTSICYPKEFYRCLALVHSINHHKIPNILS
jgi:hypothetical protein